jgi:hypothetical protein
MAKNVNLGSPTEPKVANNTIKKDAGKIVDLNFKIPVEFKREFKVWASSHDMTQKELLTKAFDLIKKSSM